MIEAPFPADELQRLAELSACGILDTPPEPEFDELARLAAEICGTPTALVSLVTRTRQWFKARIGLAAQETERRLAICAHAILAPTEVLLVEDARLDGRFGDNPLVLGPPGIRFYAGAPLRTGSGRALGTLCVIDRVPRRLSGAQLRDLEALAHQVVCQLELKRCGLELARANQRAEDQARAKAALLAGMSHEIRTPLTGVLGFAELLGERSDLPPEAREHARAIESAGRHLCCLVDDILDLAKLEAGALTIKPAPVDVPALLREAAGCLADRAHAKGLELHVELDPRIQPGLLVDGPRLRQVLQNLLSNAVSYTHAGRVSLVLTRLSEEPDSQSLLIEVRDTGCGMDPGIQEQLFETYGRARSGPAAQGPGTGLGLLISQRLAVLLGGELGLDYSVPGLGSSFYLRLTLPCAQAPLQAGPTTAAGTPLTLAGMTILLVEDGADNQRLLALLLRKAGAEVLLAADGGQALELLASGRGRAIDLVLMDLVMPGMDGIEAVRRLRAQGDRRPVVALSADAREQSEAACEEAGFDGFCPKPVGRERLIGLCARWRLPAAAGTAA
jgi:signal transduction histidine kinase